MRRGVGHAAEHLYGLKSQQGARGRGRIAFHKAEAAMANAAARSARRPFGNDGQDEPGDLVIIEVPDTGT